MCFKRPLSVSKTMLSTLVLLPSLAFTGLSATANPQKTAHPHKDGQVFAIYEVAFNGIRLGNFKFRSDVSDKRYSMNGHSKFSFLNGLLFEWKGSVHSSGSMTKKGMKPVSFSYLSNTNGKVETLSLKFASNAVKKIVRNPNKPPSSKAIPLRDKHLKNVVDPMSALMVLTQSSGKKTSGANICNRKIPVFDGKQRFDISLSYKKQIRLEKTIHNGFSGRAYICKVKYRPIAGYKPSKSGIKYMADSDDIEVWLVPVNKAKMYAPYRIVLPTIAGSATATATTFQIDQPGQARIAFFTH